VRSAPESSGSYVPPPGSIPTLPVPDLANVRRVHMIGIGGAGMRNLARLLLARGIAVTGSDLKAFNGLSELREAGADVAVGHAPEHVGRPDAVVISSAIPEHNVEVRQARSRGLPVWLRAQVLTAVARGKRLIAVAGAISLMAGRGDLQLLVLTGAGHRDVVARVPTTATRVRAFEFLDRIELAYAVADLAVARAGASNIAELTVCGIPSVLVPYPHAAANHQEANARELERAGCAELLLNSELTPETFADRVSALLNDGARLGRMRTAALSWARPDAAARLAALVVEAA